MSAAGILLSLAMIVLAALTALLMIPVLVWLERRVCGLIQDRLGPNRCNIKGFRLGGVVQSFADMIKLLSKEEYYPSHIGYARWLFMLSPAITFISALLAFMVIPFADDISIDGRPFRMQALPVEWGVLWYMAIASTGVMGILFGGWLSHNKYSLLGALRSVSQTISYEIALGLGVVSMLITYDSIDFNRMVEWQSGTIMGVLPAWGIVVQPLAAIVVITALFVESNRAPFNVAEGESEIVAGFFTEYSAMKFALFFMGEYVAMNGASAVIVTMFFGGYQLPWLSTETLRENFHIVALVAMVLLVPLTKSFLFWMKRNNSVGRRLSDDGGREYESKILSRITVGVFLLLEALLLFSLFLPAGGGWSEAATAILQIAIFMFKLMIFNIFFIVVRWTLPRFRYDQIQTLGWRYLLPAALANLLVSAIVVTGVS